METISIILNFILASGLLGTLIFFKSKKRKEAADVLGINESVFSQIMNGKRKITTTLAKKLYTDLNFSADLILQNI